MKEEFKTIEARKIVDNPFKLIGDDWMLITAGTPTRFNMMTASWGGVGVLWGKEVCFCFIRPERYTYDFMEEAQTFTLTFFEEKYRDILELCGTKSGRDLDKVAATGLTVVSGAGEGIYFAEARLVLECKKLYYQDLNPEYFLDADIRRHYSVDGYHRLYIGEILRCLSKD